jgi:hypothetical protein
LERFESIAPMCKSVRPEPAVLYLAKSNPALLNESDPSRKAYCRFQQGKGQVFIDIYLLSQSGTRNAGLQPVIA